MTITESIHVHLDVLLARLTDALPSGVLHVDADGATVVKNEAWARLTGCDGDAGIGGLLEAVGNAEEIAAALKRAVDADLPVGFSQAGGTCDSGLLHVRPIVVDGVPGGVLITLDDLTEAHSHEIELASQARRDPLTNALNRQGIEEVLNRALDGHRSTGEPVAIVFVDIDDFKPINDTWGHALGDQVLQAVAERISELLRPADFLGRSGDDEFLAVLAGLPTNDDVAAVMRRIEQELPTLAVRFREPVAISATIGAAYARPDDDFDSLVNRVRALSAS